MVAALFTAFALTSPAFHPGGTIPEQFTCEGRDVSPPLRWTAPPRGTRSLSLSVIDVDAHGFVHWRAAGIPPRKRALGVGAHPPVESVNTFGRRGYSGPCPPPGAGRHRYVFTLSAVGARGKILARARLVGRFRRR